MHGLKLNVSLEVEERYTLKSLLLRSTDSTGAFELHYLTLQARTLSSRTENDLCVLSDNRGHLWDFGLSQIAFLETKRKKTISGMKYWKPCEVGM